MDLPYNWDFIQDNISPEKLAELRRKFMEEWCSGKYTKKQMIERYRMSERTFRSTREEQNAKFVNFVNDMRAAGRILPSPKLNAQKKKIGDVRPGVRKIKAMAEKLWASTKKAKTIGKSYVYEILKKFGRYPEKEEKTKPDEFQRPPEPGKCFCVDTGTCFIGDRNH